MRPRLESSSPSRSHVAAYVTAAANLVAAAAMLVLLRRGLPVTSSAAADRIDYITTNTGWWRTGWLLWNVAAISLLGFYVALALELRFRAPILCGLAVLCAAAGLAGDLSAETLLMSLEPTTAGATFLTVEHGALLLTGYLGNGLYTAAGILITLAARSVLSFRLLMLAIPLWLSGLLLSAFTLLDSPTGQLLSTAFLMPLFILWAFLVGRWLQRRAF